MKFASRILFAYMLIFCSSAAAGDHAGNSIFGSWTVDVSRLSMPATARPKSVEITFTPAKNDRISTHVIVTNTDGSIMASESITDLNGTPEKAFGNLEADTVSTTMPLPQVLVMQLSLDGRPGSTRIYSVQPDGRTMTETAANFDDAGMPFTRINFFDRKR